MPSGTFPVPFPLNPSAPLPTFSSVASDITCSLPVMSPDENLHVPITKTYVNPRPFQRPSKHFRTLLTPLRPLSLPSPPAISSVAVHITRLPPTISSVKGVHVLIAGPSEVSGRRYRCSLTHFSP